MTGERDRMKRLVKFVPLLVLYIVILTLVEPPQGPKSDAGRYIWFAENLTKGYYSPKNEVNLWSGPGYPLLLTTVTAADNPFSAGAALNVGLMLGAVLYFYYTARRYLSDRQATLAAYVLGLWPPAVRMVPLVMTEVLSVFCMCGLAFHLSRSYREGRLRWGHMIGAGAFLGYLALTRVVFGYVIPVVLLVVLVFYLVRHRRAFLRDALVCLLALVVCLPYLYYTYSLTGKAYYWGTSGGLSLYWMSTPYEGELGDWHKMRAATNDPNLAPGHGAFFSQIGDLSPTGKDDALKQRAIENMKANPAKYFRNWIANIGRLLFGYPPTQSVFRLRTLLDVVPGMFLTVIAALCIYPSYAGRRHVPHDIWMLLLLGLVYFGGSSLLSGLPRFMLPIAPILLLWIYVVSARVVRIRILP
jgi:4-amino-4-deoxy-L-arabinose transferase-like glycosyltransferase